MLMVWHRLRRTNPMLTNPTVTLPLGHSLLSALLLAADHQFSDDLREDPRPAATPAIRRAEEYILGHISEPLTVGEIARSVRLSKRL
jgi:hypothetical protein